MQAAGANLLKCWNWFSRDHQQQGQGEPCIIAGLAREIVATYGLDGNRVYVAGLSAGGAMAVILGQTYPDVFAAIGVHSGLPYRVAHDLSSACAAMDGCSQAEVSVPMSSLFVPALATADAVIIRSATKIDAEAIAAAPNLKVVARAGVGLDNVDVKAATNAGVFMSRDGGEVFEAWSDGLANPRVVSLAISPSGELMYALGLGGAVWQRAITPQVARGR